MTRLLLLTVIWPYLMLYPAHSSAQDWPLWTAFKTRFVQHDGRVIDYQQASGITTSEGQAYALFFALVANDRQQFDTILRWTEQHLCEGDISTHLPAWRWGQQDDVNWGVLDPNSASDADLWLAYSLLEAARLWNEPRYQQLGQALLTLIEALEIASIPSLGPMLLPGRNGFDAAEGWWQLNPSYLPLFQLRALAKHSQREVWGQIYDSTLSMLENASRHGFISDWIHYHPEHGFLPRSVSATVGSYDAIRVYLWLGMLADSVDDKKPLLARLGGMREWLKGPRHWPPEQVLLDSAQSLGRGPTGFSAALLPYLSAFDEAELVDQQLARIDRKSDGHLLGEYQHYYDQVLGLFGLGWQQGLYRFDESGLLQPRWYND